MKPSLVTKVSPSAGTQLVVEAVLTHRGIKVKLKPKKAIAQAEWFFVERVSRIVGKGSGLLD